MILEPLRDPVLMLAGIALLLAGGHWLVEGSVRLARRMGVPTLLIGLTVVAFGTSAPELAFNVTAAAADSGTLAFGNVIGSNIANVGMVLGLIAIWRPVEVRSSVLRKELPLVIVVTAAVIVLAWLPATRPAPGPEGGWGFTRGDGVVLLAVFAAVTWLWYRAGQRATADPLAEEARAQAEAGDPSGATLPRAIALCAVGLAALLAGGKLAQLGAVGTARWLGLSDSIIGLTVIAIATSLPELVASSVAVARGHADIAVGNVLGSNLFNLLLVLGATTVVAPVPVPAGRGVWDLLVALGFAAALLPIAVRARGRIPRLEGAALFVCYAAYLTWGVWREQG